MTSWGRRARLARRRLQAGAGSLSRTEEPGTLCQSREAAISSPHAFSCHGMGLLLPQTLSMGEKSKTPGKAQAGQDMRAPTEGRGDCGAAGRPCVQGSLAASRYRVMCEGAFSSSLPPPWHGRPSESRTDRQGPPTPWYHHRPSSCMTQRLHSPSCLVLLCLHLPPQLSSPAGELEEHSSPAAHRALPQCSCQQKPLKALNHVFLCWGF